MLSYIGHRQALFGGFLRKMKIALLTSSYEETYGGNEYYLAKFFARKKHTVTIYVSPYTVPRYGKMKKIDATSSMHGVDVVRLPAIGMPSRGMTYLFGLKKKLQEDQPDVIHVQEWLMPLAWSCRSLTPVVMTQRMAHYPIALLPYVRLFGKQLLSKASAITTLTTEAKNEMLRYALADQTKVAVIPNGVDTDHFAPLKTKMKTKKFTIAFVGRLAKEKGILTLLDACKNLPFEYQLLVVGDGPLRSRIAVAKQTMPIQYIPFVAHADMPKRYASADVVVVPSLVEPFGFVTLEALASGIPVIGSDLGGMHDVITPDVGMKVKRHDAQTFRHAIITMHDQLQKRDFSIACRRHVLEHYSWEKIADRYLALYRKVRS